MRKDLRNDESALIEIILILVIVGIGIAFVGFFIATAFGIGLAVGLIIALGFFMLILTLFYAPSITLPAAILLAIVIIGIALSSVV